MRFPRRLPRLLAATGAVMTVALAGSGMAADAPVPVTLESAARDAVAWHPSVIEAAGTLAASGEEVAAARAGYLPTVSAGLGSGYDSRVSGTWSPSSMPVPTHSTPPPSRA